jgi:hypothetical protein
MSTYNSLSDEVILPGILYFSYLFFLATTYFLILKELYFLIAHFLKNSPFKESAKVYFFLK